MLERLMGEGKEEEREAQRWMSLLPAACSLEVRK